MTYEYATLSDPRDSDLNSRGANGWRVISAHHVVEPPSQRGMLNGSCRFVVVMEREIAQLIAPHHGGSHA